MIRAIRPAAEEVRDKPGDALANAIQATVVQVVRQLQSAAPILAEKAQKGESAVAGAVYDLDDGTVSILP
jgi:carbonic anhydrase